ncbi:MAG: hypothetical protein ACRERR_00570 [Moraxellaceae bacterium]
MKRLLLLALLANLAISSSSWADRAAINEPSATSEPSASSMPSASSEHSALGTPPVISTNSAPPYAAKLRADAAAVLKGSDFHEVSSGTVPVPRPWLEKLLKRDKPKKEKAKELPNFSGIAQILKIITIIALVLLLGWLLWRGYQWLTPQQARKQMLSRTGRVLEAESLQLQDSPSLPDSISQTAAAAWQAGQPTQALSLLYRGAVAALASHYQLSLPDGATEGDYLRLLRRSGRRELASGFSDIVRAWTAQAYASRQPDDFSALLQIYRQHFEAAGRAS